MEENQLELPGPASIPERGDFLQEQVVQKLGHVLGKILLPNFTSSDDTVLVKLYDCVTKQVKDAKVQDAREEILLQLFVPWFQEVKNRWKEIINPVKVFAFKVCGHFAKKPTGFERLVHSQLVPQLLAMAKSQRELDNISIARGLAKMLLDFTVHEDGLKWIINTGSWKDVVAFSLYCPNIYVLRKSWEVVSTLIPQLEVIHLDTAQMVVKESLAMLHDNQKLVKMGEMNNPKLLPTTPVYFDPKEKTIIVNASKLTIEILITLLNLKFSIERISTLLDVSRLRDWAWTVMHECNDAQLVTVASRVFCFLNALDLSDVVNHEVPQVVGQNFLYSIITHYNLLVARHAFDVISDSTVDYQCLWEKYGGIVIRRDCDKSENVDDFESEVYKTENPIFRVQNFLFIVQILPLFVYSKVNSKEMNCDNLLELYIEKLFRVACPKTIRFCYSFRLQLSNEEANLENLCIQNIHKFVQLAAICRKAQGVLIFQAFIHTLKYLVVKDRGHMHLSNSIYEEMPSFKIISAIVVALCTYLTRFQFSWRDSLETVCIMSLAQFILNEPLITPKMHTETLNLIKLILLNFMPPNLALLVNTLQGSSMQDLGKQLYKTLHNVHWEVRDSTLEVLTTISTLAEAKYPAFQALLLEQNFCELIASVMVFDSEPYVRASAIKCISEMVKIKSLWVDHLEKEGLLEKIFAIMHFESEAVVRREAARLAREIYKQRHIPPNQLEQSYDTFYYAAQKDLHWEVKINCLDFWDAVIDFFLSEEGMLDGSFPETIFSKEKKKIIQLTSTKKCHLVLKAVGKLSSIGCLHVLWATIFDECDLEVQKKSVQLMKKLKDVVDKYDVISELGKYNFDKDELDNYHLEKVQGDGFEPTDIDNVMVTDVVKSTEVNKDIALLAELADATRKMSVDEVIDQIVGEEDVQLLSGLIQEQSNAERVYPPVKRFIIPAEEFIEKILSTDIEKVVREKQAWALMTSESAESLLDDIIQFTKEDEFNTNSVDCY